MCFSIRLRQGMTDEAGGHAKESGAIERLSAALDAARRGKGPPPVERWNPAYCGEIDMRIAADGTWHYMGTPINRPALVKLFSTVLRKDPERYVLVTPVERVGIEVEDVPFLVLALTVASEGFHGGVGELYVASLSVLGSLEYVPNPRLR